MTKNTHRGINCVFYNRKEDAWCTFKSHTVYLEDVILRDRILSVMDSTEDPFAAEIRYHRSRWKKYVNPLYHSDQDADSVLHLQGVRHAEVRQMFSKHVRHTVLEMTEPRTLIGLLLDYQNFMRNFGFDASAVKTSSIKQMLLDEFHDKIGFHDRYHKNKSTIVYNTSAGGNYVEAPIYSWGVTDEQVFNTVARRLKDQLFTEHYMVWPPSVDELEKEPEPNLLLLKFLTWLKNPSQMDFTEPCQDPHIVAISSLLLSYITGKRTPLKTQLSVILYGLHYFAL